MTSAQPSPVEPKTPLQQRYDQLRAIGHILDQLLIDMEAAKSDHRTPTDRHIAVCITKLEDVQLRWENRVVDFEQLSNEAKEHS